MTRFTFLELQEKIIPALPSLLTPKTVPQQTLYYCEYISVAGFLLLVGVIQLNNFLFL